MRKVIWLLMITNVLLIAPIARSAPPNTDVEHAKAIEALPFHDEIDTTSHVAPAWQPEGSCGAPGPSVWYSYTPFGNETLTLRTHGSSFDTSITLYAGEEPTNHFTFYEVACNDDGPQAQNGATELVYPAPAGVPIHIQVTGKGTATGSLVLDVLEAGSVGPVRAYDNDDFLDAEAITSLPFERSVDISMENGIERNEPLPEHMTCPFDRRRTLWYRYTPASDEHVLLTLRGNRHWLSFVAVYAGGSTLAELDYVGCVWQETGSWELSFDFSAGTDYYFQVGTDSVPPEQSPINGFNLSRSPELDLAVSEFSVQDAALSTEAGDVPSGFNRNVHLEITNSGDVPTGRGADYVIWACPHTAGSCSYIEHRYVVIGAGQTFVHDIEWLGLRGAGDYDFFVRVRSQSAFDTNLANNVAMTSHNLVIGGTGVGAGAQNTCVFVLENNCQM